MMPISKCYSYLPSGAARYSGTADGYVKFAMEHQLMNADTWANFVRVFRADSDVETGAWRCEYWGKMMRGAVLAYLYNKDEALYRVLKETVLDLLSAQREDGRFSTYPADNQLFGWDMWGRKYVLTGMLHFVRICKDETLKARILAALSRHADAILESVGEGEGKVAITETSTFWGGVNSCSILEPMVDLYTFTGEARYLEFARYILSTGGCKDGDLIALAQAGMVMPYMYPEVKAYETMSFFEGELAYYEVTGERDYLTAVQKFVEAVAETDITVIGCSGCTHELFDHSSLKQTLYSAGIMQETCVTVTWMRLLARLHLLTGEVRYLDRIEQSAFNALYGSVNNHMNQQMISFDRGTRKLYVSGLPFDSYSPLYNGRRGVGIGGYQAFAFGGYYGCCACIAAAGIALVPLCAALQSEDGMVLNLYMSGRVAFAAPSGQTVTLTATTTYPKALDYVARVSLAQPEEFAIRLRVPAFCENTVITVNGERVDPALANGYVTLDRMWRDGDELSVAADFSLRTLSIDGRTAFFYGPLTLARDEAKEEGEVSLTEPITLADGFAYALEEEQEGECVRLRVERADGEEPLLLTDYASCGKRWLDVKNRLTVWLNVIP